MAANDSMTGAVRVRFARTERISDPIWHTRPEPHQILAVRARLCSSPAFAAQTRRLLVDMQETPVRCSG